MDTTSFSEIRAAYGNNPDGFPGYEELPKSVRQKGQ